MLSSIDTRILYKSDDCIVINKLKGEAVEGAKPGIVDLARELKIHFNTEFLEAAHRIDVPVTGCSLFALSKQALIFFNNAFAGNETAAVEKRYWAIAEKTKNDIPKSGKLTHWIEYNTKSNKSFAYPKENKNRKKAALYYRIIGEGINYLYVDVELHSGRHHQIRAQLASIGLHIKGDLKYGAKRSEKEGGIRLHARSLAFREPGKKDRISVIADPPQIDNLWKGFMEKALFLTT